MAKIIVSGFPAENVSIVLNDVLWQLPARRIRRAANFATTINLLTEFTGSLRTESARQRSSSQLGKCTAG